MEVRMFRKISATVFAAALLVVAAPAISASAATKVSNGVPCTRSGATTKVGTFKYQCAKNPMVRNAKLTWLSVECLSAARDYVKVTRAAATVSKDATAQIASIDEDIKAAQALIAENQAKLDTATARSKTAAGLLAAATTDNDKKQLQAAVNSWNAAMRAYQAAIDRSNASIRKLTTDKTNLINQPKVIASNIADAKANANIICQRGL